MCSELDLLTVRELIIEAVVLYVIRQLEPREVIIVPIDHHVPDNYKIFESVIMP